MKIGILGSGSVGGALGKRWAGAGHQVLFSSRRPDSDEMKALLAEAGPNAHAGSTKEAATFGEVVVLAVPSNGVEALLNELGDLGGRVLVDATNRFDGKSAGLEVLRLAKNARVVKAFNTIGWEVMENPQFGNTNASLFYAGDDAEAKRIVAQLAADIGFDPIDLGAAQDIPTLETFAFSVWRPLSAQFGRQFAIRIVRR
jgi:predicted dinucleotide-binding enzyme